MLGPNRTVGLGIRGGDGEEEGEEEASRCVVVVLVPVVRCLPCTQDSCPLCSAFASIWNRFSVKGRGGAECVPLWLCQSLFAVLAACSVIGRAVCGRAPPRRTAQRQRSALFSLLLRLHTARDEFGNAVDGESGESCRVAVTVAVATRNASALLSRSWSSSASSLPPSTFFGTLRGVLFQQSGARCCSSKDGPHLAMPARHIQYWQNLGRVTSSFAGKQHGHALDLGADPESRGNLDSSPTFGVYDRVRSMRQRGGGRGTQAVLRLRRAIGERFTQRHCCHGAKPHR